MISPAQSRMARAALKMDHADIFDILGLMPSDFLRWEKEAEWGPFPEYWIDQLEQAYIRRGVFFGPRDGVCLEQDIWKQDRRLMRGMLKMLVEQGHSPNSREISEASERLNQ